MKPLRLIVMFSVCVFGACVAHAEQQWVEVTSPHFSVITDAGEKRAKEVGLRFEQMRMAFGVIFQKVSVNTAPLEIVAFRNSKEMKRYSPLYQGKPIEVAGLFLGDGGHGRRLNNSNGEEQQYIALDLSQEDNWGTVFHEYAHLLINSNVSTTPLWFDEGFAEYCSSLKLDKKEIDLGLARRDLMYTLSQNSWLNLVDLFSVQHDSKIYNRDERRFLLYAQSWITVHYFMSKKMMDKVALYVHYTQDQHQPVPEAIQHAFGVEPKRLQGDIEDYFRSGNVRYFIAPAPPGSDMITFESRPLNDLELQTTLADFDYHARDYRTRAIATFQEILAKQPGNAIANRDMGYAAADNGDWYRAEEYFKQAAANDSKDPQVHYLVAYGLYRKSGEVGRPPDNLETMKKELDTAIALDPNYADAYSMLGMTLAYMGEKDNAIIALTKAIQLNPRNERNYSNLAGVYLQGHDFDKATPILEKLQSSSDPQIAMRAQRELQTLQSYRDSAARRNQESRNGDVVIEKKPDDEGDESRDQAAERVQALPVPNNPVLFMQGILNSVDCSQAPGAVLTVTSGGKKWKMLASDAKKMVVFGADSLSCSWTNKKIAVNYRKSGENEGQLVSLELQ